MVLKSENYFTTRLIHVVKKSIEMQSIETSPYMINKNIAVRLVIDNFNNNHVINTFRYHFNEIDPTDANDKVNLADFICGVCISILNVLMGKDNFSINYLIRTSTYLSDSFGLKKGKITKDEYNNLKDLLDEWFTNKFTKGNPTIDSIPMELEMFEMHKRVYLRALYLTYSDSVYTPRFKMNFQINIIKSYESELFALTIS